MDSFKRAESQWSWRMGVARGFRRVARAMEFISLAFPHSDELIEQNRCHYDHPNVVEIFTREDLELTLLERRALDQFIFKPGRGLVLGSGGGREAIALAKRGWQMVAMDQAPALVDAVRKRIENSEPGLSIELQCGDITQGFSSNASFDLICLLGCLYNLIPTRRLRLEVLRNCRAHLAPEGICLLSVDVLSSAPTWRKRWAHGVRKAIAWIFRGNTECEIGDQWLSEGFCHNFSSIEEAIEEIREAGFKIKGREEEKGSLILVLSASYKTEGPFAAGLGPRPPEEKIA